MFIYTLGAAVRDPQQENPQQEDDETLDGSVTRVEFFIDLSHAIKTI